MKVHRMKINQTSRKARTRCLIQLGGLISQSGLLSYFRITLGQDLQKDETIKDEVMALLGALITLKQDIQREDFSKTLWIQRGKENLDRKR